MRCRPHLKGVRTKCCYLQPKNIHNLSDGPKVPKSRLVLPSDTSISFVKACWPSKLRRLVEAFTPVRTRFLPSKSPVARPGVAAAAAARLLPREGGSCPAPASGEGGSCPAPAYVGAEPAGGRRGCRRFSIRENLLNFETLLLSRGEALVKLARVGRTKLARNTGPRVV